MASHHLSGTRLYRIWNGMKQRCLNPNTPTYRHYGGRGIRVCDEWLDFPPFYEWAMLNGYSDELSIDRIDNSGNYEPANCRWTTPLVQAANRRDYDHTEAWKKRTKTIWRKEHPTVIAAEVSLTPNWQPCPPGYDAESWAKHLEKFDT